MYVRAIELLDSKLKKELASGNAWGAANAWCFMGMSYLKLDQVEQAIRAFEETLRIRADDAQAWHCLGIAYGQNAEHEKAIKAYQHALDINPHDATTCYNIGLSYGAVGQLDKLRDAYMKLRELDAQLAEELFNHYVLPK